jgi:hypothetical protein
VKRALAIAALASIGAAAAMSVPQPSSAAPRIAGCPLFPPFAHGPGKPSAGSLRAWNQPVARSPVHPRSRRYLATIRALGGNQSVHPDFGSHPDYGIPFATVPRDQPDAPVTIGPDGYPDESDFGPAPIPPDAPVEAGSDRHVIVVQRGSCRLFEMYRAVYLGGPERSWQADATATWRLDRARLRTTHWTSADAAGLPILPGLVRYGEVARGRVRHAIRATFERTRRAFLRPATHYASSRCERYLPPMGLRLRLKRRFFRRHLSDFPRGSQSRPIFRALYRYGLLVVDNGSNWFVTGARDPRWDDDDLNRLKEVPGSAFVVVRSRARETSPC